MVLLAGFGLLATGCSLPWSKKTVTTEQAPPVLRVWRYGQDIDPLKSSFEAFEDKNKSTGISVEFTRHDLPGYEIDSLRSMSALNGPDIWSIPSDWIADYQNHFVVLDGSFFVTEENEKQPASSVQAVRDLFPEGIANALLSDDGKVIGMPTNVESLVLFYNPNMLAQAFQEWQDSPQGENADGNTYESVQNLLSAPPKTWTQLLDQTPYLTRRDNATVTRSAIALGTDANIPNSADILQLLMLQNGANVVTSDRKTADFHLSSRTPSGSMVRVGEKALDFYSSFSNPGKSNYSWNSSMPSALEAFGTGRTAMVIAFPGFENELKIKYPEATYQLAPVPQISTSQKGTTLIRFSLEGVTKVSKAIPNSITDASTALLGRYTGKDISFNLAQEMSAFSPYKEYLSQSDPLEQQILTGKTVYKKNHDEFDRIFNEMISSVYQQGNTPSKAIDTGAEKINAILAAAQLSTKK